MRMYWKIIGITVLLLTYCTVLCAQEGVVKGQLVTKGEKANTPLEYVNVLVSTLSNPRSDSNPLAVAMTDSLGNFSVAIRLQDSNSYTLVVKALGFLPKKVPFTMTGDSIDLGEIYVEENTTLLQEVLVVKSRNTQTMDSRQYLFSAEQRKKSTNALQLLSLLPGLRIDKTSNKLSSLRGGDITILINGLPSTSATLRSLPNKVVKRAIVYDVPPVEYHTSGYLINVIVEEYDLGLSGDIYATIGNLYSAFDPVVSYVKGRNMVTLEFSSHFNPRDRYDYIKGKERYSFDSGEVRYDMTKTEKTYGTTLLPSLTFVHSGKKLRIMGKGTYGFNRETEESFAHYDTSDLVTSIDQQLLSNVRNRYGEADLYMQLTLGNKKTLAYNNNTSYNDNKQALSTHISLNAKEEQQLHIGRLSTTNELLFKNYAQPLRYTVGVRSSFAKTDYQGGQNRSFAQRFLNTLYLELLGEKADFNYRATLSLNSEHNKSDVEDAYSNLNFTPNWMLGYNISSDILLRYQGNIESRRPTPQELSGNMLRISPNMYRSGNPLLRNATAFSNEILLRITKPIWQIDWRLISLNQVNPILTSYSIIGDESKYVLRQPENGRRIDRYEMNGYLNLSLLDDNLRIGLDARLFYSSIDPASHGKGFSDWFTRLSTSISYDYKMMSFEYYQILMGREVSNMTIMDTGKSVLLYCRVSHRKFDA